ncbi:DUF6429 family protein [Brevibacillus sp. H7]|uniref:DUF6429 family protein n=1 Tax=Brevibacillus sp. H7 TaxID=3349138 RepID=UPI00382B0C7D
MEEKIKELTLLLLYLTSWEEDVGLGKLNRSWKGYPFEVLNELTEEGCISGSIRAKSVYFTEKGIERAKELVKRYA